MANHRSAIKAHKRSKKNNERNTSIRSTVKTFFKKSLSCIEGGDKNAAIAASSIAESSIMKAVSKKVYKLNTASRMVANLSKKIKQMDQKTA